MSHFSLNKAEVVTNLLKWSMKKALLRGFWEIPAHMEIKRLSFLHPPRSRSVSASDFQARALKACTRALLPAEHSDLVDSTIDTWHTKAQGI